MMDSSGKQLTSVLIKPSGPDCNLACEYCYYLNKSSMFGASHLHRMSEEVLEQTIEQIMEQSPESVAISWQGGEPTLLGIEFFEKVVELERKYGGGKTVGNSFQTNGILVDEQWADFFRENQFLVGLSLDGPEHIHNHHRKHKNGDGTWDKVMRTAALLLDKEVAVNSLSVVSCYSANYPDEVYKFFKSIGINHMQFLPALEKARGDEKRLAGFSVLAHQYGEFLSRLFKLWREDFTLSGPSTFIRLFDSVFFAYVNLIPPDCDLRSVCGNYLVVEHTGEVFSCDFFVELSWKLGTVQEDNLIDLLNSSKQNQFGSAKMLLHGDCIECNWLNYCHGGCVKDRATETLRNGKSHFCESYKIFFEAADPTFKELADCWMSQNRDRVPEATAVSSKRKSS